MDTLKEIESKKEALDKILKNKQALRVFKTWLLTELSYTSNNIEGNSLTRKETVFAITKGLTTSSIKPIKDYQEIINHAKASRLVLNLSKRDKPVTEEDILNIHKEVLKGLEEDDCIGKYRNIKIRVSGSKVVVPHPSKIKGLMEELINFINLKNQNVIETALIAHFKFIAINPFIDGNGRTARLLLNLILLKNNYYPVIIRARDRKIYIKSIEKGELKNDLSSYNNFMYKAIDKSYQTYIDMFDSKNEQDKELLTISKFAKAADVPVSTVRYYLRIGKLKPISKTESDYMLFSKEQIKVFNNKINNESAL